MYSIKILNPVADGREVWFFGPHVSAWTYQLLFDIPILARIREQNPDAYIVAAGYVGEDYYYRDNKGKSLIDAYIEFPTDNMIRKATGLRHAEYDESIYQAKDIMLRHFGRLDKALFTPFDDHVWKSQIAAQYPRTHYRLGTFAPPPMDTGEYIVFHSKYSKLWHDVENTDDIAGVSNADIWTDHTLIERLSERYRVYVTGMPGECYTFSGPNIINLVDIPPAYKAPILLSLMNNAVAFVSTMAASVTTMAMLTGCPTIQFNAKRYIRHWAGTSGTSREGGWNPFNTFTRQYEKSAKVDSHVRLTQIEQFIADSKNTDPYWHDVVRVDKNLLEAWDKKGVV